MVRSHWIGPVCGVLALTGLALAQTATPHVPVPAGDAGEQIVTVQEMGKPAQKCKVLKTWTEPDGTRAYEVQALDTGERMTIEDAPPAASPAAHGSPLRAVAMRIFHHGRRGESLPSETPVPPPPDVVVNQPIENQTVYIPPPSIAATPGTGPSTPLSPAISSFAQMKESGSCNCDAPAGTRVEATPYAPAATTTAPTHLWPFTAGQVKKDQGCDSCQCAPQVVTKIEPAPCSGASAPSTHIVLQPEILLPPPPAVGVAQGPPAKTGPFKLLDPSTWKGPHSADGGPKTVANPSTSAPADAGKKTPGAVAKVETSPAQPGDWRESWGKVEPPKSPPARPDAPQMPSAVAELPAPPTAPPSPTVGAPPVSPGVLPPPSPTVAALPAHPAPLPPPTAAASPKDALPHAQAKADDPLKNPEKYLPTDAAKTKAPLLALLAGKQPAQPGDPTAKPVPLGMKSALAAGLTLNAKAPGASAGADAAMGFDPNEPNAFSEPTGKASSGANAFSEPPPPPPPANRQASDPASNAFAATENASAPGEAAPGAADSTLPTRALPPPSAPLSVNFGATRPAPAVVPAGYRPGSSYDLTAMAAVLRESLYPSQREDAAEQLGALDWRRQPEVLDLLIERAKEDPAATVRAECVRSLNRLKANTPPVVEAVKSLQSDDDPRVRHEADEAYSNLTGATPNAVQPASASSSR